MNDLAQRMAHTVSPMKILLLDEFPVTIKDIQMAPTFAQGHLPFLLLVSVVESKITTCKIFL